MPNVAPRGLFGKNGGAWKPAFLVWARSSGVWKQADYVYCYRNGAWQLIWGKTPGQPTTATATWVQPSSVRIDWTAPAINPSVQWIVRRSDTSIVNTVPVGTLTTTDTTPILSPDGTVAPYTVEGSSGTESSSRTSTNPVAFNLNSATVSGSVAYPTASTADITLTWTPNATYGLPQGWQAYLDGTGFVGPVLAATDTTTTITNQPRGSSTSWRILPMAQNTSGAWVQAGNGSPVVINVKAGDPTSVSLAAVGLNTLRISWGTPPGSFTGFEIQTYVSSWTALTTLTSTARSADWTTTVAGYMRVRTLSAGGPSDWVQVGPVAPNTDTVGPGPSTILSWKPEASYGRMVVRGNWSSDPDGNVTGQIFTNTAGAGWVSAYGPQVIKTGPSFTVVGPTGSAGQQMGVLVRTWDIHGNINTADAVAYYNLAASPTLAQPIDGWTGRGGAWRNDGTASQYMLLQGNTASGVNAGYIFYGSQLTDYLVGRTWQGGWMEVWRQNDQGSGAAIQPGLVAHDWPTRPAVPNTLNAGGGICLGGGLARTGTVTGVIGLCQQIVDLIQTGWPGLALWRGDYTSSDQNNAASLYMKFGNAGAANGGTVMGRVVMTTLG